VNNPVNKIRLVCKLRDRAEVRDEELLSKLLPEGWRVERRVAELDGSIVKLLGLNPSRDEFMLSLSLKKSEHLENLVRSIIRDCWYIDIYYNFRGDEARKAAEACLRGKGFPRSSYLGWISRSRHIPRIKP